MRFKTRKERLKHRLENETSGEDIEKLMEIFDYYEGNNLKTIEKLSRKKKIFANAINGSLRAMITAHGPITKLLIGSATKRVYGNLLQAESETKYRFSFISYILGMITFIIGLFVVYLLYK
tara:strand:+ start:203681 stop:204043 length:363 start_codon:yes stop_codon:yes gene_type:complete